MVLPDKSLTVLHICKFYIYTKFIYASFTYVNPIFHIQCVKDKRPLKLFIDSLARVTRLICRSLFVLNMSLKRSSVINGYELRTVTKYYPQKNIHKKEKYDQIIKIPSSQEVMWLHVNMTHLSMKQGGNLKPHQLQMFFCGPPEEHAKKAATKAQQICHSNIKLMLIVLH